MSVLSWQRSALAAAVLLVAAACAADEAAEPTPRTSEAQAAAPSAAPRAARAAPQVATAAQASAASAAAVAANAAPSAPSCGSGGGATLEPPSWPVGAAAEADFLPVVQSSLISVGPSRFLYNVLDSSYRQLAGPDVPSRIDFYALERDPDTPASSVAASYLSSGLGRGLYRAAIDFDCVGDWGAEISIDLPDGTTASERLRFAVQPVGSTPAIGAAAPRSDSPTAKTLAEVRLISTDAHPYAPAYTSTVAEAVTSGRPSLIFFATPAFCQSGFCGPTVELVKTVAGEYAEAVELVNVEPYELRMTANGLQPVLDEDGHLQPVPAALEYGIPVEPYLFVVDAKGDVFAKFEGIVGGDELQAAIKDVIADAA